MVDVVLVWVLLCPISRVPDCVLVSTQLGASSHIQLTLHSATYPYPNTDTVSSPTKLWYVLDIPMLNTHRYCPLLVFTKLNKMSSYVIGWIMLIMRGNVDRIRETQKDEYPPLKHAPCCILTRNQWNFFQCILSGHEIKHLGTFSPCVCFSHDTIHVLEASYRDVSKENINARSLHKQAILAETEV